MTGYIYCITNNINGKQYVGQTRYSLQERFLDHCQSSQRPDREQRPLYKAMRKYGCENFTIALLETVPIDELDVAEQRWIQHLGTYSSGYNATLGGEGKQKYTADDYDNIVSLYQGGLNVQQIAHTCACSPDTVSKILHIHQIDARQNSYKQRSHPIYQYDLYMRLLQTHASCAEAAKMLQQQGVQASTTTIITNISRVARGIRQSCYGFKWRYQNT